jgi:hypothetical protein
MFFVLLSPFFFINASPNDIGRQALSIASQYNYFKDKSLHPTGLFALLISSIESNNFYEILDIMPTAKSEEEKNCDYLPVALQSESSFNIIRLIVKKNHLCEEHGPLLIDSWDRIKSLTEIFKYLPCKTGISINHAIKVDNFDVLKHLSQCKCDKGTFTYAAINRSPKYLEWLEKKSCPKDIHLSREVIKGGNLENIKWMRTNLHLPLSPYIFALATSTENLEVMKWLKEIECPWGEDTFAKAVESGNLENMEWLKNRDCPMGFWTWRHAIIKNNPVILEWLRNNGCSEDPPFFRPTKSRRRFYK